MTARVLWEGRHMKEVFDLGSDDQAGPCNGCVDQHTDSDICVRCCNGPDGDPIYWEPIDG